MPCSLLIPFLVLGVGAILLDDVVCSGLESTILQCNHLGLESMTVIMMKMSVYIVQVGIVRFFCH